MRRVPVSRRMSPTMSWLVGPTGLSRLTTPSIGAVELALALLEDEAHRVVERCLHGAPRGSRMAAPTEHRGDGHGIGARGGADAHPRLPGIGPLEEQRDVGCLG